MSSLTLLRETVAAGEGVVRLSHSVPAVLLLPTIMKALDPSAVDQGLSQLASHRALAVTCQTFWALSDFAFVVFIWSVATMARPAGRWLPNAGAILMSISCLMDVLVAATLITVAGYFASHATSVPVAHSAGRSMLIFASAIDNAEGYPGSIGQVVLGARSGSASSPS